MRIAIVHNDVANTDDPADRDVLVQRDAVAQALHQFGHDTIAVTCSLNLEQVQRELALADPHVVFNLVESLDGTDRLMPLATLLLDALGVCYTGCPTAALLQTGDKLTAKRLLRSAGLPTPGWLRPQAARSSASRKLVATPGVGFAPRSYIIKAVFEHASLGMDDAAVVQVTSAAELRQLVHGRSRALGRICFAERYVAGREFNISLLDDGHGNPQVLPHAEILFEGFAADRPHIVGYRAKWSEDSAEYQGTPRRFDMPESDQPLLRKLTRLSTACWRLFCLRGYARIDFRVDEDGRPWILEVNANPCLSPDAGFAAALTEGGIGFTGAIARIINAALLTSPA